MEGSGPALLTLIVAPHAALLGSADGNAEAALRCAEA